MPETPLLAWVLEHLERFPGQLFRESELRRRSAEEFTALVDQGLLRYTPSDPEMDMYATACCLREVVFTAGRFWAVCTCSEEECARYGYNSRLPIVITGNRLPRRRNQVAVGGVPVFLGDTQLVLLLRLVVELHRRPEGAVYLLALEEEGHLPQGADQAIGRLRERFQWALGGLDPKEFIVVQDKAVRLATHPNLISHEKEALLRHPDARVQSLARELPR